MKARTAVMAKIRQKMNISASKLKSPGHGRKNGTEALTISARVADLHDPANLGFAVRQCNTANDDWVILSERPRFPRESFK
jgi:hypothetical protein